ncbi:two-component system sensor histidine kinase NtrB [Geobacter pickeringii]|uniref:histidine kinase n=1 Tax=Geobacter pickeringii TaxID=345632 RepID=A0A0B5BD40_9BACT|nr:HAMP domain-containing sensor histidine kinase [Geobacter pickeringii]AJE02470.1 histidine kinase [Geobacter pickeringii]
MIFKSLTTRVIVLLVTLLSVGIGTFAYLNLAREKAQLIKTARENTQLLLDTIERSIFKSMSMGDTQDVQTTLEMVGHSHNRLIGARIFHPQGLILKSSNPLEVGAAVPDGDYSLFINNLTSGIYESPGHGEVFGMIKPIYNSAPCHICHGAKRRIIGILNVNYSLAETNQRIIEVTRLFAISTAAIIAFIALAISIVMVRFVRRPLNCIIENMARVEQGDLSVRMTPRGRDEIGHLIASFDSMVDRLDTAKRELEQFHFQQMERADRLASVGEMAAGIAHEIKNPLAGIAAAMTIIRQDFGEDDPRKEIIGEVIAQVNRLDKTVNDLLFFGKPSPPEPTRVEINDVLRRTLIFALQHRGGKNIERRLQLAEGLPPVYVDPKQVQQVFLNLILNAVQAMQEGGTLTVGSVLAESGAARFVRITIADTGPGIPPQIIGKIFTPFFTTKAQGTGLGLAICQKLITQHGGRIAVASEDGNGTVFSIDLPVAEHAPEL